MAKKITKNELIKRLRHSKDYLPTLSGSGMTNEERSEFIDGLCKIISDCLVNGEAVQLPEIGTLRIKIQPERQVYVPKKNTKVSIPARTGIEFKPSSFLKRQVNLPRGEHDDNKNSN